MKIRLEKEITLIVTPESYVEQVALQAWSEKNDVSGGGLLIEAYAEHSVEPTRDGLGAFAKSLMPKQSDLPKQGGSRKPLGG